MDVRHYLEKSHPALAKPRSEGEALSELIVGELRDHRRPAAALKEIKEIRSDQGKTKQFIAQNSEGVAEIIRLNRTDLPLEGIQTKTASIILDFLIDLSAAADALPCFGQDASDVRRSHYGD